MRRHRGLLGPLAALLLMSAACSPPSTSLTEGPSVEPSVTGRSPTTDRPPACTSIGQRWVSPRDGVTLVCVPAGTFQMGAADDDADARLDTKPRHPVSLSAYWIDRTEVTNGDFAKCVELERCPPRPKAPGSTGVASKTRLDYYHDPAYAEYPVLTYTAEEAEAYCSCMGRRLPTEAEFERAAGGVDAKAYPWGDTLDCDHASYLDCTPDTTDVHTPEAGSSSFGALNMAGNVWEWVSDWYSPDYYAQSPTQDPTGPSAGAYKTLRGGGYSSVERDLLVTNRASGSPAHYYDGQMGLRCALSDALP